MREGVSACSSTRSERMSGFSLVIATFCTLVRRRSIASKFFQFTHISFCPVLERQERVETRAIARECFST